MQTEEIRRKAAELYEQGNMYLDQEDFENAVKCFKGAKENGHSRAVKWLLGIYKFSNYDITARHCLEELKYYASLEDPFAMLDLGIIHIEAGKFGGHDPYADKFRSYDFSSEINYEYGISLIDKAVKKAEAISEEKKDWKEFDLLGADYAQAADAYYSQITRLSQGKNIEASKLSELFEKAIDCMKSGIDWAKEYLPESQEPLELFESGLKAYRNDFESSKAKMS